LQTIVADSQRSFFACDIPRQSISTHFFPRFNDLSMRIPTGLNDGNLYRRRHQQTLEPTPYRRLIRLVFALVFVLVLMRQAGNSNAYRIFFPDTGERPDLPPSSNQKFLTDYSDYSKSRALESALPPMDKTISRLSVPEQDQLTQLLAAFRQSLADGAKQVDDNLVQRVREAAALAGEPFPEDKSGEQLGDEVVRMRLQSGLDQIYLKNVDDGSVWKKGDNQAFCRLLTNEPLQHLAKQKPRYVSVVAMLQQPDVYLRTQVAMNAQVAKVSKLKASANDFGITDYYELWLKPSDGSERPVAFFVQHVPSNVEDLVGVEFVSDGPVVSIEGVFLKRISFRSVEGSQLAPAIVGHFRYREAPIAALQPAIVKWEPSVQVIVISAALLGAVVALLIAVPITLSLRRSRQARLANQRLPSEHFSSLATEFSPREPK